MKNPFQDILSFNRVAGLHIYYTSADAFDIYLCLLEKKKNTIRSILYKKLSQDELDQLSELIPNGYVVALTISGSGILNKEFTLQNHDANLQRFYPENKRNDFFCYETEYRSGIGMSLCRTELVNRIPELENFKNFSFVSIDLGVYTPSVLWDLNLIDTDNIPLTKGVLQQDEANDGLVYGIDTASEANSMLVGDEQIQHEFIQAYSSALKVLLNVRNGEFIHNIPEGIDSGILYKNIINRTKLYVLGFFLLLLCINFVLYENYRNKDNQIGEQLELNNGILMQRDSLRTVLKAKEDFIKYIGNNQTWYSIMLDEIAGTVPKDIKLNSLEINPLKEKVKKGDPIEFQKVIVVTGLTKNTLVLNRWEQKLGEIDWVREAEVISYARSKDNNSGEFLVELTLVQ